MKAVIVALVIASVSVLPSGSNSAFGATPIFERDPLPVLGSSGESFPLLGDFAGSRFDDIFAIGPGSSPDQLLISQGDRTVTSVPQSVFGTYDALVGDFAGDAHDDIFWYAFNAPATSPDSIWISNGDGTWVKQSLNVVGEYRPFIGDFDGDGRDSIFWYAPGRAADSIWTFSDSGSHSSARVTVNGLYIPVVGDFADGLDGHIGDDIVWKSFTESSPFWTSTDTGFSSRRLLLPAEAVTVKGSFGGSDFDDLLMNSPGLVADVLLFGPFTGGQHQIVVGGSYAPVIGDWNGDDFDDVLWDDVFIGPDPVWYGAGGGDFDKVGQVNLQPVSAVHIVQVGDFADTGTSTTDDVLVFAGSEGSPVNFFQLYYGVAGTT